VTFANGKNRTYRRVIESRQVRVCPRHARRRCARAAADAARTLNVDPRFAAALMDDVDRRARASGGVAVIPTTAVTALPVRLQAQVLVDNHISCATFQRFRLQLGPPACGLASPQRLCEEVRLAEGEERNLATTNEDGAYLVSPRAALEEVVFYLRRQGQFIERAVPGADGRLTVATLPFEGQTSASALHDNNVRDVQICFGLDKGGLKSSCNAVLTCANQEKPTSRGNSILYGMFPCKEND